MWVSRIRGPLLIALLLMLGVVNVGSLPSPRRSTASRDVVLTKGQHLSIHTDFVDEEPSDFVEGIRIVGKWLQYSGYFGEPPAEPEYLPVEEEELRSDEIHDVEAFVKSTEQATRKRGNLESQVDAPSSPPTAPPPCSGRGTPMNKTGTINKCHGYHCYIESMLCDGILYEGEALYTYIGSMDHCKVVSMRCPDSPEHDTRFDDEACPIQKFLCSGDEKLPSELGGQSFEGCDVQVYCPRDNNQKNYFYGWEAFDYECTNYKLICNGSEVELPNGFVTDNSSCTIEPIPCQNVGNSTATCNNINSTCVTDPTDNICPNRTDHTISCSGLRQYATIGNITCGNQTHNYQSWNGSIATCQAIRSVKFQDSVYELPYNQTANTYCVLTELDCGGIRVPWNFTARIPEGCGVSRIVCGQTFVWPPGSGCTTYEFGCATPPVRCTFSEQRFPCGSRCLQPGLTPQCDCPVDWAGATCNYMRTLKCQFNVTSASIVRNSKRAIEAKMNEESMAENYPWDEACDAPVQHKIGYPVCHPLNLNDNLRIYGLLSCRFNDGPLEELMKHVSMDYNYTVYAEHFRVSNTSLRQEWKLMMKVWNFDSFSDIDGSIEVSLTPAQMAGNSTISFQLTPSNLDHIYIAGGRMRAEWMFYYNDYSPFGMLRTTMYGTVLDAMDWKSNYPKGSFIVSGKVVAIIVLSLFVAAVLALYVFRYWRKRQDKAGTEGQ